MNKAERSLLAHFKQLPAEQKQALTDYAEWLASRYAEPSVSVLASEPIDIMRPAEESVVKAIRRLSQTYPMLNTNDMLTKTSTFMTRHVMHGQDSVEVIDEMEAYFRECYEKQKDS